MAIFDIHLHTDYYSSCSLMHPGELIQQAVKLGLDGIAITEHGIRWPDEKFDELRRQAEPHGLILINGQEVNTYSRQNGTEGDFLVFGVKKSLGSDFPARELVAKVQGEGGILIAAHPYKRSRLNRERYFGVGDLLYELALDALELYHPHHDEEALEKVRRAMEVLGLPGTGSSDAHKVQAVGSYVTIFENPVQSEEDFIREIRAGRVRGEKRF